MGTNPTCSRLRDIAREGPTDPLEETTLALAELFTEPSGFPSQALGLSGSLLLGLHPPGSDIDLVACVEDRSRAVHRALSILLDRPTAPVRRPEEEQLAAIHEVHRVETPLSRADFAFLQAREVNEGSFRGHSCFIRFVTHPDQVSEWYGDPRYELLGCVSMETRSV